MQLACKFPISLFLSMPNTYKFQIGSSFPPFSSLWAALGSPQIQHVVIVHVHAQSCLTLCDSMNCILLGSSVHGIFQAGILEWVAISSSRGFSQFRKICPWLLHWQADSLLLSHLGSPGSIVAAPIYIPINSVEGFPSPHIISKICYLQSLKFFIFDYAGPSLLHTGFL